MTNQSAENASNQSWSGQPAMLPQVLTPEQVAAYDRDGFLFLENLFSAEEVATILAAVPAVMDERSERTVFEADRQTVRSVYGVHQNDRVFSALARHPRLVEPVRDVLRTDPYIYQSKINTKAVFGGDVWPWHQDYVFWLKEDAMPAPRALTLAVFLDDVTEHSGALSLIPGSHRDGVLETDTFDGKLAGYDGAPDWIANVVARLKYTVSKEAFLRLATTNGIVTPKGRAGSAILFHSNTAHASSINLSPYERRMVLFTYSAIDNAPAAETLRRPEFLVSRDTRPLVTVADDFFRTASTSSAS